MTGQAVKRSRVPNTNNRALVYRKSAPGDTVLEGLEKKAREARKGLWADSQPVRCGSWSIREQSADHMAETCYESRCEMRGKPGEVLAIHSQFYSRHAGSLNPI